MNYNETLEYIHTIPKFKRPLGNANLKKLLGALNNPQDKLRFVHIAGTNGKGSTAAMTAEILKRSGYKTGLFTSPYLEVFNERISINGDNISDEELIVTVGRVKTAMEQNDAQVSEFAFITAAALLYFYEKECDVVVLEAGMGGRLDATNVIGESLVSVICKIGLDHIQYLGETVEEIAREKCGIIRDNGHVVSYPNGAVNSIIRSSAAEKNAELVFADTFTPAENGFMYKGKEYELSLKGAYQPQNAAVVIETVNVIKRLGFNIPEKCVTDGLRSTRWAARFEFVRDNVVIDGGHNIDGIRALIKSLSLLKCEVTVVIAMMQDKDYVSCVREIAPAVKNVIATEIDMPRCLKADKIKEIASGMNDNVIVNTNMEEALKTAVCLAKEGIVCVCGSLYLAGEARKFFRQIEK